MCNTYGMPGAAKQDPGPLTSEVAARLRARVAREKLAGKDIAAAVGVSPPQMSKILDGKKQIDIELLDRICWAIGQNFDDLIREADEATSFRYVGPDWNTPTLVRH